MSKQLAPPPDLADAKRCEWNVKPMDLDTNGFMHPVEAVEGHTTIFATAVGTGKSAVVQSIFRPVLNDPTRTKKHVVFVFTSRTVQTHDDAARFKEQIPHIMQGTDPDGDPCRPIKHVYTKYEINQMISDDESFSYLNFIKSCDHSVVITLTGETLRYLDVDDILKCEDFDFSLCRDEVQLFTEKFNSETTKDFWYKGEASLRKLREKAVHDIVCSADIGHEGFDARVAYPNGPKTKPEEINRQAWVDAVQEDGAVRMMCTGMNPSRTCDVYVYSQPRMRKTIKVVDKIDWEHWFNEASHEHGRCVHVVLSSANQAEELCNLGERMGKKVFMVAGGRRSNHKEKAEAFADIDKYLEDNQIDIFVHTNSVSVGIDIKRVKFWKQLGATCRTGGSLEEWFQGLARVGRHGNLKDTEILVELNIAASLVDEDCTWRAPSDEYTFEKETQRYESKCDSTQRDMYGYHNKGYSVSSKGNTMPAYANQVVAYQNLSSSRSKYDHAATFVKYACLHHYTLVDARQEHADQGAEEKDAEEGEEKDDGGGVGRYDDHHLPDEHHFWACIFMLVLNVENTKRGKSDDDDDDDDDDDGKSTTASFSDFTTYSDWVKDRHPPQGSKAHQMQEWAVGVLWELLMEACGKDIEQKMKLNECKSDMPSPPAFALRALLQRAPLAFWELAQIQTPRVTTLAERDQRDVEEYDRYCMNHQQILWCAQGIGISSGSSAMHKLVKERCAEVFELLGRHEFSHVFGFDHRDTSELNEFHEMTYELVMQARRFTGTFPPYGAFKKLCVKEDPIHTQLRLRARMIAFASDIQLSYYEVGKFSKVRRGRGTASIGTLGTTDYSKAVRAYRDLCTEVLGVDPTDAVGQEITKEDVLRLFTQKQRDVEATGEDDEHAFALYKRLVEYRSVLPLQGKRDKRKTVHELVSKMLGAGGWKLQKDDGKYHVAAREGAYTWLADHYRLVCPVAPNQHKAMSAEAMRKNLSGECVPETLPPPCEATGDDWQRALAFLADEETPKPTPLFDEDGRPNNELKRYELIVAGDDHCVVKDKRMNVVRSYGNVRICEVFYRRTHPGAQPGEMEGRFYVSMNRHQVPDDRVSHAQQTIYRFTRTELGWQVSFGELDLKKSHLAIEVALTKHFFPHQNVSTMVGYLEHADEYRDQLRAAFGFGGSEVETLMLKKVFLVLNMGGKVERAVGACAEVMLSDLLCVDAKLIWADCKDPYHFESVLAQAGSYLKSITSIAGTVFRRGDTGAKIKPEELADALVRTRAQYKALKDRLEEMEDEASVHHQAYKMLEEVRVTTKHMKTLLLSKLPKYIAMCKDPETGKFLHKRNNVLRRQDEYTALHLLLSDYETHALLYAAEYAESQGYPMDTLIHDGGLLRRKQLAKTQEEASRDRLPPTFVADCEAYVWDKLEAKFGIATFRDRLRFDLKPFVEPDRGHKRQLHPELAELEAKLGELKAKLVDKIARQLADEAKSADKEQILAVVEAKIAELAVKEAKIATTTVQDVQTDADGAAVVNSATTTVQDVQMADADGAAVVNSE